MRSFDVSNCENANLKDEVHQEWSVVIRLGDLHTQMSFLGSISHLMASSELSELLEMVLYN
jgi:hypothetical protein